LPKLIITNCEGEESEVEAEPRLSLMETIREAGFDELVAMCGGCCSCATCHVIADNEWIAKVGNAGDDEFDLLERSDHRMNGRSERGARIALSAAEELQRSGERYALAFMCVGVGQGIGLILERV
jgi:2Fe-2S ferredoxin